MKVFAGFGWLILALTATVAVSAQVPTPGISPTPVPAAGAPTPGSESIVPGSLSAPSGPAAPVPSGPSPAAASTGGPESTPAAAPGTPAASHFHLHRPGTDVDGDLLTGNAASNVYIFKGNVTLRSDPKIDRELGGATESSEPIVVTADEIDVDKVALTYVAKGHVHFVQGARSGRADVAMLNEQTHELDLLGNADVLEGERRARAAKMHYNTADRRFHGSGDVRLYQPLPTPDPAAATPPPKRKKRRLPL